MEDSGEPTRRALLAAIAGGSVAAGTLAPVHGYLQDFAPLSAGEGEWIGFEPFESADWEGDGFVPFEEKPHHDNPAYVGTANQRVVDEPDHYVGEADSDPYRGIRVYQAMDDRAESDEPFDRAFSRRLHHDTIDLRAEGLVAAARGSPNDWNRGWTPSPTGTSGWPGSTCRTRLRVLRRLVPGTGRDTSPGGHWAGLFVGGAIAGLAQRGVLRGIGAGALAGVGIWLVFLATLQLHAATFPALRSMPIIAVSLGIAVGYGAVGGLLRGVV